MNLSVLSATCFLLSLMSNAADAIPVGTQIMLCGKVKVTTTSAAPGKLGAAVITTYVATAQNIFKLQSSRDLGPQTNGALKDGAMVTIVGVINAEHEAGGRVTAQKSQDGTVPIDLILARPGCQ